MKQIEFPNKMDLLLGKITVVYTGTYSVQRDDFRITDIYVFESGRFRKLPVLIKLRGAEITPERATAILKLLEKGEIGILASFYAAKMLKLVIGREPDCMALYGSVEFWQMVLDDAHRRYGVDRDRLAPMLAMFGGHMAAMRFIFSTDDVLFHLREYTSGLNERDTFARHATMTLFDFTPYEDYPTPDEPVWTMTLDFMRTVNSVIAEKMGGADKLFELKDSLPINIGVDVGDKADELFNVLKQLHPRAVEKRDEHTFIVKHLF